MRVCPQHMSKTGGGVLAKGGCPGHGGCLGHGGVQDMGDVQDMGMPKASMLNVQDMHEGCVWHARRVYKENLVESTLLDDGIYPP